MRRSPASRPRSKAPASPDAVPPPHYSGRRPNLLRNRFFGVVGIFAVSLLGVQASEKPAVAAEACKTPVVSYVGQEAVGATVAYDVSGCAIRVALPTTTENKAKHVPQHLKPEELPAHAETKKYISQRQLDIIESLPRSREQKDCLIGIVKSYYLAREKLPLANTNPIVATAQALVEGGRCKETFIFDENFNMFGMKADGEHESTGPTGTKEDDGTGHQHEQPDSFMKLHSRTEAWEAYDHRLDTVDCYQGAKQYTYDPNVSPAEARETAANVLDQIRCWATDIHYVGTNLDVIDHDRLVDIYIEAPQPEYAHVELVDYHKADVALAA